MTFFYCLEYFLSQGTMKNTKLSRGDHLDQNMAGMPRQQPQSVWKTYFIIYYHANHCLSQQSSDVLKHLPRPESSKQSNNLIRSWMSSSHCDHKSIPGHRLVKNSTHSAL